MTAPPHESSGPDGPLFSVLVATYDRPALLREAIESVLAQTVSDFELIVVDDAAPRPATVPDDPRVKLVRRASNGGQGASYNSGLASARGRYVTFLDDDDCYFPERLEIALEGFARAPVVVCRTRLLGGESAPQDGAPRRRGRPRRTLEGDVGAVIREGMTPVLGQTAVERAVALPFDESFRASADVEWWIRMAQRAPVATVDRPGLLFRCHQAERHGNSERRRVEAQQRILEVHADHFAAHPRAAAFQLHRIGVQALRTGDAVTARAALARSLVRRPRAATAWHLGRSLAVDGRTGRAGADAGPRPPLVLFVSTPGGMGGSTRSLATILEHLRGVAKRVVTTTGTGAFVDQVAERRLADVTLPFISNAARLRPVRRGLSAVRLAAWSWRRRSEIAAVHANGLKELSVAVPAVVLSRRPLVVWVHDHTLPPSIRAFGWLWRTLLAHRDVRWAAVSPTARARVVEAKLASTDDVAIIPNPIDPADVRADHRQPAGGAVRIGYLGAPEHYKGFDLLPEVIERTAELPVRWLVFSNRRTDDDPTTWERLEELSATGQVVLEGKLTNVAEAYARCDVVFCPSRRDSFCRVAAEAMLNAIPVVGSDLEPIRALIGQEDAGLLFPVGDAVAAAAALRRLVLDAELRHRLGAGGPARAGAFATAGVMRRLAELYGIEPPRGPETPPEDGPDAQPAKHLGAAC